LKTVICAPVYSPYDALSTRVAIGIDQGLEHESGIHCDELVSIPKISLTHFIATLPPAKIEELNRALAVAVGLDSPC